MEINDFFRLHIISKDSLYNNNLIHYLKKASRHYKTNLWKYIFIEGIILSRKRKVSTKNLKIMVKSE